jgi:short-subunit dehydrogenase
MKRNIEDSVVVITGASSGIGRAAALMFARRGGTVVVTARQADALREVAQECERLGGRALAVPADVTKEQAVRDVARQAIEHFGRIDVWVNNAAVTMFGRVEEVPYEACRQVIETNLFGYLHGARAVLPYFREQGSGVLINVSSQVGKIGSPFVSLYSTTKFAIVGLAESLRMEVQDAPGIHVCTILPASIDTPLFQHGANYTGRAVKPLDPVYPAEQVAAAILQLAEHPRRELVVGSSGRKLLAMRTVAPPLAERLIARQVEKNHFEDRSAPASDGNLFEPMSEWNTVSGGWRTSEGGGRSKGAGLAVIGLGLGLGILAWNRFGKPQSRLPWR